MNKVAPRTRPLNSTSSTVVNQLNIVKFKPTSPTNFWTCSKAVYRTSSVSCVVFLQSIFFASCRRLFCFCLTFVFLSLCLLALSVSFCRLLSQLHGWWC
jgi:hypothetical protein